MSTCIQYALSFTTVLPSMSSKYGQVKKKSFRELVKTILHARDPLFGGQGKEETMGLSSWVGGYMREHGSLKLGGGIYERTWVFQAGWGDI